MSGKFVRASKYRHVFGQAAKRELQYENMKVTNNAWDSNLIKTNGKFISVNWNASGGGAFAVIPLEEVGKSPDQIPLFRGHTAHVLDTDFDPFNERRIASGSDDSKIGIWDIPDGYSFRNALNENDEIEDVKPTKFLTGHSRKVGHVLFHPVAQNVLASSSLDHTVKIWDIESGEEKISLKHPEMVTSMSFSYDGNYLATVARDKKLRVWDVRANKIVSEGPAHSGAKNQRVVWLGNSDRIATTGFSRLSDRQIGIWDAFNLEKGDLGGFYTVDQSSGIMMPFYDDDTKILYLVGKGDGNIRYYEFQNDELFELSEYQSVEPQRGFAIAPKRTVNIRENEVIRGFKTVLDQYIEPVSFYVPRRSEEFQEDIYPDAPSDKPALSAEEWLSGKSVEGPILVSMKDLYEGAEPIFHDAKKASSSTNKDDYLKEGSEIAQEDSTLAKKSPEIVKESPAAEKKEEAKEIQHVNKIPTPEPSQSNSSRDSLKETLKSANSVDKMLKKSKEFDSENKAEDPSKDTSGWDEEDEAPKDPEPVTKIERIIKPQAVATLSTEAVKENSVEKSPASVEKVVQSEPEESVSLEAHNHSTNQSGSDDVKQSETTTAVSNTTKSMGLKQSVERLSSLVVNLEKLVNTLEASNLEKDDRLRSLEAKIAELVENK